MSFIGLHVPHETARLLSELDVPGTREPLSEYHITLVYLGENTPITTLSKVMEIGHGVTRAIRPFTVQTRRVTCFPRGEDGVPIICPIESPALHAFRKALVEALDANGIEYSKRHPEYKPHVTLAYAEEPIEELEIPVVGWGAHEIVLWGGDSGDGRLTVTFPLSLRETDAVVAKVLTR